MQINHIAGNRWRVRLDNGDEIVAVTKATTLADAEVEIPAMLAEADMPTPPPAPRTVTFRQFLLGLMGAEWVSAAEAEAWAARSALPASVTAVIAALPEAQRPAARVTALTMTEVDRADPLVIAAATAAMPGASEPEVLAALEAAFAEWSAL